MTLGASRYKACLDKAQPGSTERPGDNDESDRPRRVERRRQDHAAGRVIPHLLEQGLRVSVIKHAHHEFDVDVPGKDSGCTGSPALPKCWCLRPGAGPDHELRGASEPRLPELLTKMSRVDLVVVEGFKREPHRKIEVHRLANGKPLLFPDDPDIAGIATDTAVETTLPRPISMTSRRSPP